MAVEMKGRAKVPVRCPECAWSARGGLTLVDRYETDFPPGPRGGGIFEVYRDPAMDPDDRVVECPDCGEFLDEGTLVERTDG